MEFSIHSIWLVLLHNTSQLVVLVADYQMREQLEPKVALHFPQPDLQIQDREAAEAAAESMEADHPLQVTAGLA
jgi:hypothetical protein